MSPCGATAAALARDGSGRRYSRRCQRGEETSRASHWTTHEAVGREEALLLYNPDLCASSSALRGPEYLGIAVLSFLRSVFAVPLDGEAPSEAMPGLSLRNYE
jgi:hypothetical protein